MFTATMIRKEQKEATGNQNYGDNWCFVMKQVFSLNPRSGNKITEDATYKSLNNNNNSNNVRIHCNVLFNFNYTTHVHNTMVVVRWDGGRWKYSSHMCKYEYD